jgi:hypothetical protein
MTHTAFHRIHAQLTVQTALDDAGFAELTLTNTGSLSDVYRLRVATASGQPATTEPAIARLEPGSSQIVTVVAAAPVVVRVYSQLSGQRVAEAHLDYCAGDSRISVTGPSLTELTAMSAPNTPRSTDAPSLVSSSQKAS